MFSSIRAFFTFDSSFRFSVFSGFGFINKSTLGRMYVGFSGISSFITFGFGVDDIATFVLAGFFFEIFFAMDKILLFCGAIFVF